jgi:polyisoprenoid-binding protein YceI
VTTPTSLRSRPIFWVGVLILAAAIAGGGYGIWYLFLKPGGPPPVDIGAVAIPTTSPAAASATLPATSASAAPSSAAPSASSVASSAASTSGSTAGVDGTWKVDQSLDSFVGYRVQEQLASIGANTAVGRTPDVTGTMTIQGAQVTAAEFTADLTGLKSDDDRRDGQLRRQGIETATFPNATFKLTAPLDFGSVPADGQSITVSATGDFTLHGVTKSVQVQLSAKRSSDVIVVTGSLPITFADYNISKPQGFVVLSIDDHGTMEFQLLFTKG